MDQDKKKVSVNVIKYPVKLLDGFWHIVTRTQILSKTYIENDVDPSFNGKEDAEKYLKTMQNKNYEVDVEIK